LDRLLACALAACVCVGCRGERGGPGQPCFPNDSCTGQLVCVERVCREFVTGNLGEPCFPNGTCNTVDSIGLVCVGGACELPDCPNGTIGCGCRRDRTCSAGATCSVKESRCVRAGCAVGELGCLCADGLTCSNATACRYGVCWTNAVAVKVGPAVNVHACDIVLKVGGPERSNVTWPDTIRGQFMQRSGALALSFIERTGTEAGINGTVATIAAGGLVRPELLQSECYDGLGNTIAGVRVALE
jgi:hypothetical protein